MPDISLEDMTAPELIEVIRTLRSRAGLVDALAKNPQTRESLQRLIKTVSPDTPIPEIDAADKLRREMGPLEDKLQKLQTQMLERDVRDRIKEARAELKAAPFNLTDEQVLEVEKIMTREVDPIPSYKAAAQVFLAERRSATPTPSAYMPPTYSMPEKETWARGIGNAHELNRIALNEAFNTWNDLKAGKVAGLGAAVGRMM